MTCLPIGIKHTLLELVLLFYCVISYICSTFSFRLPHSGRHRALLLPSSRWQCGVSRPVLWVVTSTLLLNSLELVLPRWEWLDLALELERCSGALLLVMPGKVNAAKKVLHMSNVVTNSTDELVGFHCTFVRMEIGLKYFFIAITLSWYLKSKIKSWC